MEWLQIFSLFLANAGLIIWFRSESRNDWRHMDSKVDAIHEEMKDFHARLCVIEERRGNFPQKRTPEGVPNQEKGVGYK